MPQRKPVVVESLTNGRWKRIGEFSTTRAKKLALLMRREGQIVRTDAEVPTRGRIGWQTSGSGVLGSVDDIDIFVLGHQPEYGRWALYTRLPGHDGKPVYADTEAEAKSSADEILDTFIRRMGVSTRCPTK
jgi:hypothetical protein